MRLAQRSLRWLVALYPDWMHKQLEAELPAMTLAMHRLAGEVLEAEMLGIAYGEAVDNPRFYLMGRVHYGVADTLQSRIPAEFVEVFREMLQRTEEGDFDDFRQLAFATATQKGDLEGALCRFLLWQGMRLNVMIATWDNPGLEAAGLFDTVEQEAEKTLKAFLTVPDMLEPDVRPLNVLVAAAVKHLDAHVGQLRELFARESEAFKEILSAERLVALSRRLDDRHAAVFWPGEPHYETSSQQIADRYPQHFSSANAVEAQRSRTKQLLARDGLPEPSGDRAIDLIREFTVEVR